MKKQTLAVVFAAAALWAPQLQAQAYPSKPIRVVKDANIKAD